MILSFMRVECYLPALRAEVLLVCLQRKLHLLFVYLLDCLRLITHALPEHSCTVTHLLYLNFIMNFIL